MANRRVHDWEAIEKDYRAGQLSIREIARLYGCNEKSIRTKSKKLGWERDLSCKVDQKVKAQLARNEARSADPLTDEQIVDTAAARVVEVIRSHRKTISAGNCVVESLTNQLSNALLKNDPEKLKSHASTAVSLSIAMKNLIGLERQAFNIKDESGVSENPMQTLLNQINGVTLGPPSLREK